MELNDIERIELKKDRSKILLEAIKNQISPEAFPPLEEIDGAQLIVRVNEGSLEWAFEEKVSCW